MKKFYAMMVAALFSASIFAVAPTQADLAAYVDAEHYVACFSTPAESTCNDIVWVGTYNGWNLSDEEILVCEPLPGFDGWYVVAVPAAAEGGENSGKPVQKNECGKLEWAYQNGNADALTLLEGEVDIVANGDEADLKNWGVGMATIVEMTSWKLGNNPCDKTCDAQDITVRVFDPFCEENPEFEPTLMGSFNNWSGPAKMEFQGSYYEYVIEGATATLEFKFNNDMEGSWDNQFEYYIPEDVLNDVPARWSTFGNFKLDPEDEMSKFYTREGNVITFHFDEPGMFRYAMCGVDDNEYTAVIWLNVPVEGAPAAEVGVEIIGSFDEWAGTPMELLDNGWYFAQITAKAAQEFKFREAGNWDNQILEYIAAEGDWSEIQQKFGDVWTDDTYKGNPVKSFELDYSDAAKYCWSVAKPDGIENVVLTEQAQKVVVDGVLYIVRDNKMFNVQGAQVR